MSSLERKTQKNEMNEMNKMDNQLYMFSMLSALKTGNPLLDGLIIILLPTIVSYISQFCYKILETLIPLVKKMFKQDYYLHKIEYMTISGLAMSTGNDNYQLYTAVCVYTNSLNLDIKDGNIQASIKYENDPTFQSGGYSLNQFQNLKLKSLDNLKLLFKPSIYNWIKVTKEIELMFEQKEDRQENKYTNGTSSSSSASQIVTYSICIKSNTLENIKDFIIKSIKFYKNESVENKRYLYLPKYTSLNKLSFNSHLLNDSKTFESLFIPDKKILVDLLINFQNRTGRYAIPGVKQQLGMLLHGPPGTGKTSLIKSVASMFNRNIITIPLGLISTNSELFEIMFNLDYSDQQGYDPRQMNMGMGMGINTSLTKKLNFNELVFVIEDIDAIGDIVHKRQEHQEPNDKIEEPNDKIEEPNDKREETNDKMDRLNETLEMIVNTPMGMPMSMPIHKDKDKNKDKDKDKNKDKLNLAGILNAIDGIVDAPGRIIIITSNFPEKLDKALIRPGRIDKIINLDYIKADQAIEMCNNFFGPNEVNKYESEIKKAISKNNFSPAQIEQYALEIDNIQEFLKKVERIERIES